MRMRKLEPVMSAAATTDNVDSGALYIITLSSSTAPMALEAPALPELTGLAVFRSRRVEDGRDRFRLHVGYFESIAAAEAVLPKVRRHFPAAWAGPAPSSGMGSLDDTSLAQFKFIKAPNTIQRPPAAAMHSLPPVVPAARRSTPRAIRPVPSATVSATLVSRSIPGRRTVPFPAKPAARLQPIRPDTGRTPISRPAQPPRALAARDVLKLLETGAATSAGRQRAVEPPRQQAQVVGALQRFAVQLIWSMDPVNLAEVPKLAIFDAYTLYKVQVDRAGRRWYGLRLGFFADPVSARQVALYSRSDFTAAAVVPVSDRECDRAAQAAITDMPAHAAEKKPDEQMRLIDLPRGATTALDATPFVTHESARDTVRGRAKPITAKIAAKPVAKPSARIGTTKPPRKAAPNEKALVFSFGKSMQELAEELSETPDFGDASADPLNDSGVRHLAVKIVKKRSTLGRFFSRGSRRP